MNMIKQKTIRRFAWMLSMGVALYCGRLLFRTYTRVLIADGIVWEYVGGNNSRILQKGLLIMGPGGIELADHGEYIVGMCHYGDTCKASWFVINKISGAIVEDDHLYKVASRLRDDGITNFNYSCLKTFQSWKRR